MKKEDFYEWYNEHVRLIVDNRYNVKGTYAWTPFGFKLQKLVYGRLVELLEKTGHQEVRFPTLIPETQLMKEEEHVRGFKKEVYWVTHGGYEPLGVKLALRPTSETALTFMESFWLKSYKQLPKKYYQVVSIFRYETKATRPMLRVREVTTFKEAHTAHEDFKDSERQVREALEIYSRFFDELGIPYVISKRPEWDKFAGAIYTIAFDTLLPDGKALQIGTVHNLGQNFTRVFEVRIQRRDETIDYAWQTSYGISERVIASVISIHGDRKGLVLPFKVAPIQVIVIPIPTADRDKWELVLSYCNDVLNELRSNKIRADIDLREELRPVDKFYYWELRGVPIRLDIGVKEVNSNSVTIVRRDSGEKVLVERSRLLTAIKELARSYDANLRERAWRAFKSKVFRTTDLDSAREFLERERGLVEIPWCGRVGCVRKVSEILDAEALGTPLELNEHSLQALVCPICGKTSATYMRYAKKY